MIDKNQKKKAGKIDKVDTKDFRSKIKNFAVLKKEYDFPDENLTLGMMLRKLSEYLEFYMKIIQQILQPEEFSSLYECTAFDDKEKSELLDLYKQIIITHREMLKAEVLNEEKNSLSTLQFAHEEIRSLKPKIVKILDKMKESWKKTSEESHMQYFG